jgi:hypothetical protein
MEPLKIVRYWESEAARAPTPQPVLVRRIPSNVSVDSLRGGLTDRLRDMRAKLSELLADPPGAGWRVPQILRDVEWLCVLVEEYLRRTEPPKEKP